MNKLVASLFNEVAAMLGKDTTQDDQTLMQLEIKPEDNVLRKSTEHEALSSMGSHVGLDNLQASGLGLKQRGGFMSFINE